MDRREAYDAATGANVTPSGPRLGTRRGRRRDVLGRLVHVCGVVDGTIVAGTRPGARSQGVGAADRRAAPSHGLVRQTVRQDPRPGQDAGPTSDDDDDDDDDDNDRTAAAAAAEGELL